MSCSSCSRMWQCHTYSCPPVLGLSGLPMDAGNLGSANCIITVVASPGFIRTAQPLAAGVIILATAINYLSVRSGGRIQLLTSSLKVGAIAALIVLGFVSQKGNFASLVPGSTAISAGTAGASSVLLSQ